MTIFVKIIWVLKRRPDIFKTEQPRNVTIIVLY